MIMALRRQRQADLCEFKANLVYRESSKQPGLLHREILSQEKKKKKTIQQNTETKSSSQNWAVMMYTFNPRTQEVEAERSLS